MHARAKAFALNKKIHPFEIYENDPASTEENELVIFSAYSSKSSKRREWTNPVAEEPAALRFFRFLADF